MSAILLKEIQDRITYLKTDRKELQATIADLTAQVAARKQSFEDLQTNDDAANKHVADLEEQLQLLKDEAAKSAAADADEEKTEQEIVDELDPVPVKAEPTPAPTPEPEPVKEEAPVVVEEKEEPAKDEVTDEKTAVETDEE